MHHSQVVEYLGSDNASTVILAFVMRGVHLTWVEDFCVVCNNPVNDAGISYCLPILTTRLHRPAPWSVPRFPYRWQFSWINDEEQDYIVYDQEVNYTLCQGLTLKYAPPHVLVGVPPCQRWRHDAIHGALQ